MTRKTSGRDNLSLEQIDMAQLDIVVGGALEDALSPQLRLAAYPVGGWTMRDVFARPAPFTYH
ncbi:hypothetical protein JQ604_10735 [Bradyrhizobium jicamae]|uniref:hypothetical protein n=1 Tax=Bradyrhizobium jicamae TaxID=280332 RepID=UPI001BA968C8|nr:hypothetical protein [Bradyrhizobium jicamae]MBR0752660.1 hypothetical protein [Bradyrhizobium jicamae]